jgi:hypothetical protein
MICPMIWGAQAMELTFKLRPFSLTEEESYRGRKRDHRNCISCSNKCHLSDGEQLLSRPV